MVFRTATTDKGEEPNLELRELMFMKNNYGPIGARVLLRWKSGVFVPEPREGSLEKAAAKRRADRFNGQGCNVSEEVGPSYAPRFLPRNRKPRPTGLEGTRSRLPWPAYSVPARSIGALRLPPRGTFRIAAGQKP